MLYISDELYIENMTLNDLHIYRNYKLYFLKAYNEYKKYNGILDIYLKETIAIKGIIKIDYQIINIKKTNDKIIELNTNDIKEIIRPIEESYNNIINNQPKIIKDGRKQYYLINDKLYKVKKDKSYGKLFGSYIDGKIIEGISNDEKNLISKVSKKKISTPKIETKITKDKEINGIEKIINNEHNDFKISKTNIIINVDSNKTNEKKFQKNRIKKSNNDEIY